jgi:nitrile hydratase alpha subunit
VSGTAIDAPDHDHDHDHDHEVDEHAPQTLGDGAAPPSEFELTSRALQELLQEQGLLTADQVRRYMEALEDEYPQRGSQVVARAWVDPEFKRLLLEDGKAACAVMGIPVGSRLIAVENTPDEHNVIVCTLCSCYPRDLLGTPPTWYKSDNYRSRVVHEPRAVLQEFGTVIPDDVTVRVHDSNADMRYVVVPMRPAGTDGWSEEQLAAILSRDTLVGVALPSA